MLAIGCALQRIFGSESGGTRDRKVLMVIQDSGRSTIRHTVLETPYAQDSAMPIVTIFIVQV